jgi:hypothetical protein
MVFGPFDPIFAGDLRSKIVFGFGQKSVEIADRLNFMSLGVLGEYSTILLAFYLYTLKNFLCISLNKFKFFLRIQNFPPPF